MGVEGHCDSMDKQLIAWRKKIEVLVKISERLPAKYTDVDAKQLEELGSLIEDLERVRVLLKKECLPA